MDTSTVELNPPHYHKAIVNHLKSTTPKLWEMFQKRETQDNLAEETSAHLLKKTVRLSSETYTKLYSIGESVKEKLAITVPLSFYQTTDVGQKNAMLYYASEALHIVLQGDILEALSDQELTALLGHEMAHFKLWSIDNGTYFIADRLIDTNASYDSVSIHQLITARNYQLYTEIYADLGAYFVTDDIDAVISMLIKIETGLTTTDVAAFLKQAEELHEKGDIFTEGISHPEAIIRARALSLKKQKRANYTEELTRMIEGAPAMEKLDVLGQKKLHDITRSYIRWFLTPVWMQADACTTFAGFFGVEIQPLSTKKTVDLRKEIRAYGTTFHTYFSYLLVDFIALDHDLEDIPLVRALLLADELDFRPTLEKIVNKELKYRKNVIKILWDQREEIFKKAENTLAMDEAAC